MLTPPQSHIRDLRHPLADIRSVRVRGRHILSSKIVGILRATWSWYYSSIIPYVTFFRSVVR